MNQARKLLMGSFTLLIALLLLVILFSYHAFVYSAPETIDHLFFECPLAQSVLLCFVGPRLLLPKKFAMFVLVLMLMSFLTSRKFSFIF